MKFKTRFVVLLTLVALVVSACGAIGQSQPVVMRVGWAGSPDTLNPGAAVLSEAYTIFGLVFDTMYQLQLDGSFKLSLAESVNVSDDGLVYTYKIRDGVKFHDGEDLTAEDVVFTYYLYQNTEGYPWMGDYT
ncbi:MAG TPA: ABC transporter substrate-binding protein, partial [Anaerolineales bacterium]